MKHLDMFGAEINFGDFVVGHYGGGIDIFVVLPGKGQKMLRVKQWQVKNPRVKHFRYSKDLIKLSLAQFKAMPFKALAGK